MIAHAMVRLDALTEDMPSRDLATYTVSEVTGEGADWEAAKAAAVIPEGAQLLSWRREL